MSTDITSIKSPATKGPRRKTKTKSGPTLSDLIIKILSAFKKHAGVSLVALKKGLAANGYDVARNNSRIKQAVKRLVVAGKLTQTKGTGASGSFKIGRKIATKQKKRVTVKKGKSVTVKKGKSVTVKKGKSVTVKKAKSVTAKKAKTVTVKKNKPAKNTPKRGRKTLKSLGKADETVAVKTQRPKRAKTESF